MPGLSGLSGTLADGCNQLPLSSAHVFRAMARFSLFIASPNNTSNVSGPIIPEYKSRFWRLSVELFLMLLVSLKEVGAYWLRLSLLCRNGASNARCGYLCYIYI